MLTLFNLLSPKAPRFEMRQQLPQQQQRECPLPLSGAATGPTGQKQQQQPQRLHLRWQRVWLGLLFESLAVPICMAISFWSPSVEWGGVRYRKARGRVEHIERS